MIDPTILWFINNGSLLSVAANMVTGLMVSVWSPRKVMLGWTAFAASACVVVLAAPQPGVFAFAQFAFGIYAGNVVTCMLVYMSLASSLRQRSAVMLAGYFSINSLFPAVVTGMVGISASSRPAAAS